MSRVYVTTYEVIGAGIPLAEDHAAAIDNARAIQWAYSQQIGGAGFRPSHNGGVRTILFDTLPKGWRKVGLDRGKIEGVPRKDSKAGKEIAASIAALPEAPQPHHLAAALGYNPSEMALDSERGTIYFPTTVDVSFPTKRYFVRLPRFDRDGFDPDANILRAIPESELMKALEDHNAEARRRREEKEAA